MNISFPQGFMWGTATAAHQVEGNNVNSDSWVLEHLPHTVFEEPSGDAIDHYHRYESDIALLASLGFNSYRFSIEWARVEPEPGFFSTAMLDHYKRVLTTCHTHGLRPVVSLHHFTSPRWLITQGGWRSQGTVARFADYCARVACDLGDLVDAICTINEVNIPLMIGQWTAGTANDPKQIAFRSEATQAFNVSSDRFSPFLMAAS
jgi:beta-glucosidase